MKYKEKFLTIGFCFLALLASTSTLAENKAVIHVGYESGGDEVMKVYFPADGSTSTIKAGDGLVFAVGAACLVNPEVTIQTTLGWKYQTIQRASNGDAYFNRFPLDVIAQYSKEKVRVGTGLTYHIAPKLNASGDFASIERSFDNAPGMLDQLDYITEAGLMWGVRGMSQYPSRLPLTLFERL